MASILPSVELAGELFLIGNFCLWGGVEFHSFSLFFCWLFLWMGTEREEEVFVLKLEKDGRDSRGQEGYHVFFGLTRVNLFDP